MTADALEAVRAALGENKEDLPTAAAHALLEYRDLLVASNRRYSLLSAADANRVTTRHFTESAILLRWIPKEEGLRVLDFGSGGGLPGIVIQILRPESQVTLLEARHKKRVFLRLACHRLGLRRARVAAGPPELLGDLAPPYARVTARGVGPLEELLPHVAPLVLEGGLAIIPKGSGGEAELSAIRSRIPRLGLELIESRESRLTTRHGERVGGYTFVFRGTRSP